MSEILVSHPEELLLAREATRELPESALVTPELPVPLIAYFRAVVMDGDVHEHAVVLGAADLLRSQRSQLADFLSRRKPTRVTFAEALSPGRYELWGDALGPRDASLLGAVAYACAGFDGPAVEIVMGGQTSRVSAALDKRFWRCSVRSHVEGR